MNIDVSIGRRHSLAIEVRDLCNGEVRVVDRTIDVKSSNLFLGPFVSSHDSGCDSGNFSPLKEKVAGAFRLLDLASEAVRSNPLVMKLVDAYHQRIPKLLAQLDKAASEPDISPEHFRSVIAHVPPQMIDSALRAAVQRIDAEMPYFFRIERALGTYDYLLTGSCAKLPSAVGFAGEAPSAETVSAQDVPYLNPQGTRVEFLSRRNIAFIDSADTPTSLTLLESLYVGGTLGEELRLINRAAAVAAICSPVAREIEALETARERLANHTAPSSIVRGIQAAVLIGGSAAVGVCGVAPMAVRLVTEGAFSLVSWSAPGTVLAFCGIGALSTIIGGIADCMRDAEDAARRGFTKNKVTYRSTLASVLLRFVDARSFSSTVTSMGPETLAGWRHEIGGAKEEDPNIVPQVADPSFLADMEVRIAKDPPIDLDEELETHIRDVIDRNVGSIHHIDQAQRHWNVLYATDVLERFLNPNEDYGEFYPAADLRSFLLQAEQERVDAAGRFASVCETFNDYRDHYGITKPVWSFISRPLFALDLLERVTATQRAREIAREELAKALAVHSDRCR